LPPASTLNRHGVEWASSDFGVHGNMNRDDWAGNVEDRL